MNDDGFRVVRVVQVPVDDTVYDTYEEAQEAARRCSAQDRDHIFTVRHVSRHVDDDVTASP